MLLRVLGLEFVVSVIYLFSMSLKSVFLDAQSREFKYNRQAFDQKARSMTEKYAQAAASGSVCDSQFQSLANPSAV